MALRFNDAKCNALAGTGIASLTRLRVYTGAQPASANDPPTGTLLGIINFIVWGTPGAVTPGVVSLAGTFSATALAAGTPGWGRFDNGSAETLVADGAVGSEFTVSPATVTAGALLTLTGATFTQPSGA